MNNLLTAIMTKITTGPSALDSDVAGRVFLDQAPQGVEFPYIVFSIVSDVPEKTYSEDFENVMIQFSLFSISESVSEIADMYADLKTLFDECSLTITSSTLVWMKRSNLIPMIDEITTVNGTLGVKHWAVDYDIKTSLD